MTFVVMGLGTVFNALTNRRDPASGLDRRRSSRPSPISLFPVAMIVLATELPGLQSGLLTIVAHRPASGSPASGSRSCSRSSSRRASGCAAARAAGPATFERRRKPCAGAETRAKQE